MTPLPPDDHKWVIYQMMIRLFGNLNTTNRPWGTRDENGVGKFGDVNGAALAALRDLGATHVWYTGVIEHALCTDYRAQGIPLDDADVVKGRAGSPYAIKDYYDVNPDLAADVPNRMREFEALVARTHDAGLGVLVDFVPNHVARHYQSDAKPEGVRDFGADDDPTRAFAPNNNFYYLPGQDFRPPAGYVPLGGQPYPTADGAYAERPAKVSGNGAATTQPRADDWFETVRLNYGVNHPGDGRAHFEPVPNTWHKCLDVLLFWTRKGVDGFRCDMVEMVPVPFWAWVIPQVRAENAAIRFIGEIYNPALYDAYLHEGQFDYLYDKVGTYDALRAVMEARPDASLNQVAEVRKGLAHIDDRMLRFLENHDEQRIASPPFAGDARAGVPGMAVTAALGTGPVLVYFGQEVGEPGAGHSGFSGDDGRTTIFDYWGVPQHQRWVNGHRYDGGHLDEEQRTLRARDRRLLRAVRGSAALRTGAFYDLQAAQQGYPAYPADRVFSFFRYTADERVLVVANFIPESTHVRIHVPEEALALLRLPDDDDEWQARNLLNSQDETIAIRRVDTAAASLDFELAGWSAVLLRF
ncbi:MAG: alpha-amylase family glycosyl hydrolase [Catalinimonas sp.]